MSARKTTTPVITDDTDASAQTRVLRASDWHELFPRQADALISARRNGRLGQAYLFAGDSTEELRAFAYGWAKTAACTAPTPQGHACGRCANCRHFESNTYPELFLLEPESKIATIKVEPMHDFIRQMTLTVPEGMIKFGILPVAEAMQSESANAFLKTLEEPVNRVMFLLLTTKPQYLLPTIRSRCQNVFLRTNRMDYTRSVPAEFLEILSTMHRCAGAGVALAASRELGAIFSKLKKQAEQTVKANANPEEKALTKGDAAMKRQLEVLEEARVATEYLRLQAAYLDAIQAWFRQRYLLATNVPEELLPQPELLPLMKRDTRKGTTAEAEQDLQFVETFRRALRAKVPEDLCLDAFTLAICEVVR